jgi:prophage maintenance system killer protein
MSAGVISRDDVRFINLVAARRFAQVASPPSPSDVSDAVDGETPYRRAASLAAALLRPGVLEVAALPTALLAVACQLARDGYSLTAPQGAAAGMVRDLARGTTSIDVFAAWLEDRAVPA